MRKLTIYLSAIMLLGFAACSSDDEDNDFDEKDHPKRKVSKIETCYYEDSQFTVTDTEYFTYDKDGRWTNYRLDDEIGDRYEQNIGTIQSFKLQYSNELISVQEEVAYEDYYKKDMSLNKQGYISQLTKKYDDTSSEDTIEKYYYENGNLTVVGRGNEGREMFSYIYEGDEVVESELYGDKIKITYTTIENKMNFGLVPQDYHDDVFDFTFNNPLAQFGLFGKQPKYLVKSIFFESRGSMTTKNYRYILDNEGFVTEVRIEKKYYQSPIFELTNIFLCKIYYQ